VADVAQMFRKILTVCQNRQLVEYHQLKDDLSNAGCRSPVGYILGVLGLITCSERFSKLQHAGRTRAVGKLPEEGIE